MPLNNFHADENNRGWPPRDSFDLFSAIAALPVTDDETGRGVLLIVALASIVAQLEETNRLLGCLAEAIEKESQ